MLSALKELKIRADLILARARRGEPDVLARVASIAALSRFQGEELIQNFNRKQALNLVAREFGFKSWNHVHNILTAVQEEDFGTMLFPKSCSGFLNNWYSDYSAARDCRAATGGFLLAYGRQFLVVSEEYIRTLGLDPGADEWQEMGYDWARPAKLEARSRLYSQLFGLRPAEQSAPAGSGKGGRPATE